MYLDIMCLITVFIPTIHVLKNNPRNRSVFEIRRRGRGVSDRHQKAKNKLICKKSRSTSNTCQIRKYNVRRFFRQRGGRGEAWRL